jgi:zinc D-Ala-D-Ala dipeptidase
MSQAKFQLLLTRHHLHAALPGQPPFVLKCAVTVVDHNGHLRMRFPLAAIVMSVIVCIHSASWILQSNDKSSPPSALAWLSTDQNFADVSDIPNLKVNLRYASENNFLKKNVYGDFHQCFLHRIAAEKLRKAATELQEEKPGWKLLAFDCLRPRSVQEKLFAVVKGTPQQPYVADPRSGSIHNYGFAIDLSLEDESGRELDMGTAFDDFTPLSQPNHEREYLEAGKLTKDQIEHRFILRNLMLHAGFVQLPIEWWHYDALPKEEVKKRYKIVE